MPLQTQNGKLLTIGSALLTECCCTGQWRGYYTLDCASRMYVWNSSALLTGCDYDEGETEALGGCLGYYYYGKPYYCEEPVDDTQGHGSAVSEALLPCCCNPCVYCSPELPESMSVLFTIPNVYFEVCSDPPFDTDLSISVSLNRECDGVTSLCPAAGDIYNGISDPTPTGVHGYYYTLNAHLRQHCDDDNCFDGWSMNWTIDYPPNPDYGEIYGSTLVSSATPCDPKGSVVNALYSFFKYGTGDIPLSCDPAAWWSATIT